MIKLESIVLSKRSQFQYVLINKVILTNGKINYKIQMNAYGNFCQLDTLSLLYTSKHFLPNQGLAG